MLLLQKALYDLLPDDACNGNLGRNDGKCELPKSDYHVCGFANGSGLFGRC